MINSFEQVHNYFERLVFEEVMRHADEHPQFSDEMLADVACVALNRLPPRYVRHYVDFVFYLTEQERHDNEVNLKNAVKFAYGFVEERTQRSLRRDQA